jgi:hypothetical protein
MEVITTKFPTEREIHEIEKRLEEMRARREEAKQLILQAFKSGEVINSLSPHEAMGLLKQLQARLHGARTKRRGSPVPPELLENLKTALKEGRHTLSQLEKMFGLSISYISRVKSEMREGGELAQITDNKTLNAYEDRPLQAAS